MTRTAVTLLLHLLAAPALAAPAPPVDPSEQFPSLLGGESLHGSSTAQALAGFASLSAAYGQGITTRDDLGGQAEFNWSTTELVVGAFWRHQLGRLSGWDLAGRVALGWYADAGSRLIYDDNLEDRGVQLAPGMALSSRGVGLLALSFDLPVTFTTWRGHGVWMAPRLAASYEAALYDRLSLGVRGAVAWRGGSGGAPMRKGQVLPELLVTATWMLF
jgi:hypothetical protein